MTKAWTTPTLVTMQGDATVLLVSVGQPPEGLQEELERLEVHVVPSGFADAEESIDSESPDLIVLSGARGAMEMATLLDDQEGEHPPRMVIVAARKDLAKLRGLNREIVISLFALETTEKVVAQRIESLARRAARRRRPAEHGAGELQKTAMGLPTATVGKLALKQEKEKAPSPPRVSSALTSGPASSRGGSRAKEAPPPFEMQAGEPSKQKAGTNPTQGNASAPGRELAPETERGVAQKSPAHPPRDPGKATALDLPQGHGASQAEPPRAAPPRGLVPPAEAKTEGSQPQEIESLVPDEELVSLRPSEFAEDEDEVTKVGDIPKEALVPEFEGEASAGKLPPGAMPSGDPAPADPLQPGELDISAAESALENLDSVKLDMTDEMRAAAHERLPRSGAAHEDDTSREEEPTRPAPDITDRDTPHVPLDAAPDEQSEKESAKSKTKLSEEPVDTNTRTNDDGAKGESTELNPAFAATQLGTDHASSKQGETEKAENEPDKVEKPLEHPAMRRSARSSETDGAEKESRASAGSAAQNAPKEQPLASDDSLPDEDESPSSSSRGEPAGGTEPQVVQKKGGGALAIGLAAVAVAAVGAAALSGVLDQGGPSAAAESATAVPTQSTAQGASTQPSGDNEDSQLSGSSTESPQGEVAQAQSDADGQKGKPIQDGADSTTQHAPDAFGEEAETADASSSSDGSSSGLPSNPFVVKDSGVPDCKKLLGDEVPKPGGDPVHEASLVWNEARKLIVKGKVDQAHRKMCEAVSLNPESAAAEGLASLYLRLGSPRQALDWLEKADKLRPGQNELVALRGDIYGHLGKTEKAREIWLEMLGVEPEQTRRIQAVSKDYSVDAGRHLRRGDLTRADLWFRRAIILDPGNLAGVMGLAKTFYKAEKPAYARAFALRALEVSDVIPEVHVLLGEIALEKGNKAEAKERFERALEVRPGFFPAKRGLAEVEK